MHYEASADINRPVGDVFEFFLECSNIPQWVSAVEEAWHETDDPVSVGSRMTEIVKLGPRRSQVTWEITAFEENRLCTWETESEVVGKTAVSKAFKTVGDGTRITVDVQTQLKGWLRFVEPFLRIISVRQRKRYLSNATRILETGT